MNVTFYHSEIISIILVMQNNERGKLMSKLVNVVGLGYIGLPTALMLAVNDVRVVGTDNNDERITKLKTRTITFNENGLNELFSNAIERGICFENKCVLADVYIVAVPTPYNKRDRKIVPDYLVDALLAVLNTCKNNSIIIIESTISPGTIDKYIRPLINQENEKRDSKIEIVHAPERIIPGRIIEELQHNNRIIGVDNWAVGEIVKELYSKFCEGEIVLTNIRTAELAKVAENTFRDINIAYANELVKICREAEIDVYELITIANMHPRVNILTPGPGVGGHCISVDPWFLVGDYPEIANLILTSRKVNDSMPEYVLKRISEIMDENNIEMLSQVGLYGLTYKENVDDIRESPTLQLLMNMRSHASKGVKVYDPYVTEDIVENQVHSLNSFIDSVQMVVVMVGHDEIIDNCDLLKDKVVFDTRNILKIDDKYTL